MDESEKAAKLLLRQRRREDAENSFVREGAIGLIGAASLAVAGHVVAERFVAPYRALNWRMKLVLLVGSGVAGFAIRAEHSVIEKREEVFLEVERQNAEKNAAKASARSH